MKPEPTTIMTDGKKSGAYYVSDYWFFYQNELNEPVILIVYHKKKFHVLRAHIESRSFHKIHQIHLMEAHTIMVKTKKGKQIFNYKIK